VADLDADAFAVREKASQELEQLGPAAEPALLKALQDKPAPELRQRVESLLKRLETDTPSAERLRSLRALEVLEHLGTPEARATLEALAKGAVGAWLTEEARLACERLARRSEQRQ
jgi:hypothetical protein